MAKQKGFSKIAAVVMVLLVAALVYVVATRKLASPSRTLTPPASQDQTAGWRTYTNAEHGFELKYPTGLSIDERPSTDSYDVRFFDSADSKVPVFTVSVGILFDEQSLIKQITAGPSGYKKTGTASAAGKSAQVFETSFPEIGPVKTYVVSRDRIVPPYEFSNLPFQISFFEDVVNKAALGEDFQGNVLSTFKFTSTTSAHETAGWTTHTNSEWGFSLRYPTEYYLLSNPVKRTDNFVNAVLVQVAKKKQSEPSEFGPEFSVMVTKQPFEANGNVYRSIEDVASAMFQSLPALPVMKKVSIDGYQAIVAILPENEQKQIWKTWLILKDGLIYQIAFNPATDTVFENIAASFHFLK